MKTKYTIPNAVASNWYKYTHKVTEKVAEFHGLTDEQLLVLSLNLGDPFAFAATMLLLRPDCPKELALNKRECMRNIPPYLVFHETAETDPVEPAPITSEQIDTLINHFMGDDVNQYLCLFYTLKADEVLPAILNPLTTP